MKLICRAQFYWESNGKILIRRNQHSITDWVEVEEKFKEKYLALSIESPPRSVA